MSELYVIFMSEIFNSWPISLEMSSPSKIRFKSDSLLLTDTYAIHTYVRTGGFCRSHRERTNEWTNSRLDIRARNFKEVRSRLSPSAKLQILGTTLNNGASKLGDPARTRALPRNKKWATAISRLNYPPVSKLKLPSRLPNILRSWVRYADRRRFSLSLSFPPFLVPGGLARDTPTSELSAREHARTGAKTANGARSTMVAVRYRGVFAFIRLIRPIYRKTGRRERVCRSI